MEQQLHSITPAEFEKAYQEHLEHLDSEGVAGKRMDLSYRDFSQIDFTMYSEIDLRYAFLFGCNLTSAKLAGANLEGAFLGDANMDGADLEGANLDFATLSNVDLGGANLQGAQMEVTNLAKANLSNSNLTGANLTRATLTATNLEKCVAEKVVFYCANLEDANLNGSKLKGADFGFTHVKGVKLEGANLDSLLSLGGCHGNGKEIRSIRTSELFITYTASQIQVDDVIEDIGALESNVFAYELVKANLETMKL